MLKWFLLFTISGVIVFSITLYFKLGGYKAPTIELQRNQHQLQVIYKSHLGPYHKINDMIKSVEDWAFNNNVPCKQTFGEYLDIPGTIADERLRANAGCVTTMTVENLPADIHQKSIPARDYIYASFEGSPAIGPFKVYPEVMDWAKEKRIQIDWPVIEIYNVIGPEKVKTEYLFPAIAPANL